jgi:HSP20 family protein
MAEKTDLSIRERFAQEIAGIFDDFGFGRNMFRTTGRRGAERWAPQIDVKQEGDELVVRADLPGMKSEDVNVNVTEDVMTLSGERKEERETERGGVYHTERSYGSFFRTIPLPQGAIVDQAKATFKNGVLEIRMPAPPEQVTRGRQLRIEEAPSEKAQPQK